MEIPFFTFILLNLIDFDHLLNHESKEVKKTERG